MTTTRYYLYVSQRKLQAPQQEKIMFFTFSQSDWPKKKQLVNLKREELQFFLIFPHNPQPYHKTNAHQ